MRNLSNSVRRAAVKSANSESLLFKKFMPTIAKLLKLEGDRRAVVGWWSGSLAKEDGLVPKDRVAGVFAARQAVLQDKYAPEAAALQICETLCFLVRKTSEAVLARGGINHLPITDGWDTLVPNTTVSSLSSNGIDSDNSSSNLNTE